MLDFTLDSANLYTLFGAYFVLFSLVFSVSRAINLLVEKYK